MELGLCSQACLLVDVVHGGNGLRLSRFCLASIALLLSAASFLCPRGESSGRTRSAGPGP